MAENTLEKDITKPVDGAGDNSAGNRDDFNADDVRKKADGFSSDELLDKYVSGEKRINAINGESAKHRTDRDDYKNKYETLQSEIDEAKKKGLVENEKYKELYEAEIEKTKDFDRLKEFETGQIETMNVQITELEGKLSTESKELYEVFTGNENISASDKLKYLNKAIGTNNNGIHIDPSKSHGGTGGKAVNDMTMTEINEHFQKTGVVLRKTK